MRRHVVPALRLVLGLMLALVLAMAGLAPAAAAAAPVRPATAGTSPLSLPLTVSPAVMTPAVEDGEYTAPAVSPFTDVSTKHVFYRHISWLAENKISTGWAAPNNTAVFRPGQAVLREQMAAFLYRLAGRPEFTAPAASPFTDVSTKHVFYKEIAWLAENGISTGWPAAGGTRIFRPGQAVLRDQMAAFLYRVAGEPEFTGPSTSPFTDIATTHVFYDEIAWLADTGVSTGWPAAGGTAVYRPGQKVLREQMAAFLYRIDSHLEEPSAGLTIPSGPMADGIAGIDYLEVLAADGGAEPLTWTATGLPKGLSVSPEGIVTGTPAGTGTSDVTITATDANGATATVTRSLAVPEAVPAQCVEQNCAVLEETAGTIEIPAEDIVSIAHDPNTQEVTEVTLTGVDVTPGQNLVLAPTAEVETGVTITAESVTTGADGTLVVSATQTTFGEAYTSGAVHSIAGTAVPASEEQAAVAGVAPGVDSGAEPMAGAQAIEVEDGLKCGVGVDADVHSMSVTPELKPAMYSQWGPGGAEAFSMGLEGDLVVNINASVEGKGDCELMGKKFYAATPPGAIGPLGTIIFTFHPHLRYEFNDRADFNSTVRLSCRSYYVWTKGNGENRTSYCKSTDQKFGMSSASGLSTALTAAVDLQAALNGVIGVGGELNTGVRASYESARRPATTLSAFAGYEVYACLGCFLHKLSLNLTLFKGTFYEAVIWQSAGAPPAPQVGEQLAVVDPGSLRCRVDTPCEKTITATGGSAPYEWQMTGGRLPEGAEFDWNGRTLGVPTTAGTYTFTVTVTDARGATASREVTIRVDEPIESAEEQIYATDVAAGNFVLKPDGTVWAWGGNGSGTLGTGSPDSQWSPVQLQGLKEIVDVHSASGWASYAVTAQGRVWAWGSNYHGQVGNGSTKDTLSPVLIEGLSDVVAMADAGSTTYALKNDGTVWGWGDNTYGQLGSNPTETNTIVRVPVQIPGLSNIKAVDGGYTTGYALDGNGNVWAWGSNHYGALGDGTEAGRRAEPAVVPGLTDVAQISGGWHSAYAVQEDGTVWAWGIGTGELTGDGAARGNRKTPGVFPEIDNVAHLVDASYMVLALKKDGTTWAWGSQSEGALGLGYNHFQQGPPARVQGLPAVKALNTNGGSSLAVDTQGRVWGWGILGPYYAPDDIMLAQYTPMLLKH